MMADQSKEEEEEKNMVPVSETFKLEAVKNSDIKVSHKYTLGTLETQTFYLRFDP
jgi:hypothetical protein